MRRDPAQLPAPNPMRRDTAELPAPNPMRHGTAELPQTEKECEPQTVSEYSGMLPSNSKGRTNSGCWRKISEFKTQQVI
jgi:hypothetical protein